MATRDLTRLFSPRSVAVYGSKWADYVIEQCGRLGYSGQIWRVHPTRDECFRSAAELPGVPDAAFLGVRRDLTIDELARLRAVGLGGAVCFASGFIEAGDGNGFVSALSQAAGEIPFLGPNCYGFINYFDRVALWPDQLAPRHCDKGVAIVAQSGTLSITLMGQRRSLPIGYVITLGNQQNLTAADIISFVCDDPRVSAIGLYLETIADVPAFVEAAKRARDMGKPIAAIKAGRSERARATALSHTGSLAGADRLHDALFDRLGIARCETLSSLVETLKLLHMFGPLANNSVFLIGASGGDAAMVGDVARDKAIDFNLPRGEKRRALRQAIGHDVPVNNPLDFGTRSWFDDEALRATFDAAMACEAALIGFVLDPPDESETDLTDYERVVRIYCECARRAGVRAALISSLPESLGKKLRELLLSFGVVPLQGLEESLEAIMLSSRTGGAWRHWRPPYIAVSSASTFSASYSSASTTSTSTSSAAIGFDAKFARTLTEAEAKSRLEAFGLDVPARLVVPWRQAGEAAQKIGLPVVVKALGADFAHKSEVGGVAINLDRLEDVESAAERLSGLSDRLIVERMISDGVAEFIVGAVRDPQFGFALTIGAGGIFTELLKDSATLLYPMDADLVRRCIDGLRVSRLLDGWRGGPAGDLDALVEAVLGIAGFVEESREELLELDINPLIVRPKGFGVAIVDALMVVRENKNV